MPYIKADDGRREALRKGEPALSAGELNYQIFYYVKHSSASFSPRDIEGFVEQFLGAKPNYQRWNDMTGALVRCTREITRRLYGKVHAIDAVVRILSILDSYDEKIAIYENEKIISNGDVE